MITLLNAGANPFAVDDEGRTPLHWLGMLPEDFDEASRDVFVALTRHCPAGKYYGPEYSPAHDVTHGAVLESVFADPALDVDLVGTLDARGRTLLHVAAGRDLSVWMLHLEARKVQTKSIQDVFKKAVRAWARPAPRGRRAAESHRHNRSQ